jgi:hypothetical protein
VPWPQQQPGLPQHHHVQIVKFVFQWFDGSLGACQGTQIIFWCKVSSHAAYLVVSDGIIADFF